MKPCFSMNLDPTIASTLEDCFRDAVRIVTQVGLIRAHFQFNGRTCTVYANGRGSVEDSDGRILSYWDVSSPQTMVLEGNNPWMTMAEYDALRERLVSQPIETERESIPFLNSLPSGFCNHARLPWSRSRKRSVRHPAHLSNSRTNQNPVLDG